MPKSGPCSVLESIADEIGGLDKTIERLPLSLNALALRLVMGREEEWP